MRRLVAVALACTFAFTVAGSPPSRAATLASSWPVGRVPFALAQDSTTGKVYVANSETVAPDGTGRISVVDPATGVVASLTTTLPANFVLIDAAARRLYSSNATLSASQSSVDEFNLETGERLGSVSGGGLSLALDSAAQRLFVCGTRLVVIDTSTFTLTGDSMDPPTVGGAWFGVALDPARDRLYLTDSNPTTPRVFVFSERDRTAVGQIALSGVARYAIAVDPNGRVLVASSDPNGGSFPGSVLEVIDPESLSVGHTTSLPGLPAGIAFAPARGRVYISDMGGRRVYGVDDVSFTVAETIDGIPFTPGQPLFHSDGRLYLPNATSRTNADSTLVAVDLANHAPVFQTLSLTPAQPTTNETLHADAFADDPDLSASGDHVTYAYEWSRNGVVLAASGPTLDLSVANNGDRGDTVSARVTASDGEQSAVASTSVVIADSAPTAAVSVSNAAPTTDAVLTATAVGTDPDNDALSYHFVWKVNGVVRRTTSGSLGSDTFDLGVAENGDRGDVVVVELVTSDGTLESGVATAGATVVDSPPTVAVSLNTTTPTMKTVLVATVVGQDPDRDGLTYVYTWKLNGVVRRTVTTTATTDRYDVSKKGNGKKGDVVTVTVTATDGTLTSPAASLSATIR
jgi:DNA-binding beta-propeller fold protein YncE